MRFPYRDFKRDWHPGDRFCRWRSIKMRFYRHIDIYKVEFMLNKYLKRWVQFVDTVIWVTNTTEYTELIGSEVASKWFSHSWMIARTLPKQAHPGRRSPRARFAGTGGFIYNYTWEISNDVQTSSPHWFKWWLAAKPLTKPMLSYSPAA